MNSDNATNGSKQKLQLLAGADGIQLVREFETRPADGYPAVIGTLRPALPAEVIAYRHALTSAAGPAAEARIEAEFYRTHLVTWDAETEGNPAPINELTVAALPWPVWRQFEAIILGSDGEGVLGN